MPGGVSDLTDDDGTLGGAVLGVDDLEDGLSIVTMCLQGEDRGVVSFEVLASCLDRLHLSGLSKNPSRTCATCDLIDHKINKGRSYFVSAGSTRLIALRRGIIVINMISLSINAKN
jgi:hypothetical protein